MNGKQIPLLFSHPRSGTHLTAHMLGIANKHAGFRKSDIAKPTSVSFIIKKANKYNGLFTHYPYTEAMSDYLKSNSGKYKCYANFRDPRDIIVSYAHVCEEKPNYFWNYMHGKKKLTKLPFSTRIDYLIDDVHDSLFRHDNWRTCGLCELVYYKNSINHPVAEEYTFNKRRGVKGSYKDEMAPEQIDRCNHIYGELIEEWG